MHLIHSCSEHTEKYLKIPCICTRSPWWTISRQTYLFPDHKSWAPAPVPWDGQLEAGYSLGVRDCHLSIRLWLPWNVTLDQTQSAFLNFENMSILAISIPILLSTSRYTDVRDNVKWGRPVRTFFSDVFCCSILPTFFIDDLDRFPSDRSREMMSTRAEHHVAFSKTTSTLSPHWFRYFKLIDFGIKKAATHNPSANKSHSPSGSLALSSALPLLSSLSVVPGLK